MKKILIISAAVLFLASCQDFLTNDPKGVMTEEEYFASPDAGLKSLIKCYHAMDDFWGFEHPLMVFGNIATDESEKGGSDASDGYSGDVLDIAYGRAKSSNMDINYLWENSYEAIANCNMLLSNLETRSLHDASGYDLSEQEKQRYMAEAKFLRAYYYFDLVKIFGGVPKVDKVLTVNDSKTLVRASEAEIADFIMKDLEDAASGEALPLKSNLPASELGRVTREAAWAMQARVYMYFAKDDESNLAKGRDAAKKVIDSGSYSLEPKFLDLFLANGYASNEGIFTNIRGDVPSIPINGSFIPVYSNPRCCGAYGFDQPTQALVDEFEEGDPRLLYTVIEPGDEYPKGKSTEVLDFSTYPSTGYHNRKAFLVESRRGNGWGNDAWSFHLIRYADILLLYAEALIRTDGSKEEAAECINMIRRRANASRDGDTEAVSRVMTIPDIQLKEVSVSDDLLEAVRHERRVELAMEYNRLYDLKRWNEYIDAMNAYAGRPESNGRGAGFKKGINEVFPIPQSEIDRTGKSIVQNNGYN